MHACMYAHSTLSYINQDMNIWRSPSLISDLFLSPSLISDLFLVHWWLLEQWLTPFQLDSPRKRNINKITRAIPHAMLNQAIDWYCSIGRWEKITPTTAKKEVTISTLYKLYRSTCANYESSTVPNCMKGIEKIANFDSFSLVTIKGFSAVF